METIKPENIRLIACLKLGEFKMAQKQIDGEHEEIQDLVNALADLFGNTRVDPESQVGIIIKHALMRAGVDSEYIVVLEEDSHVAGRLFNDKYESAHNGLDLDEDPHVVELVNALAQMMGNPGCFDGSLGLVVGWAKANIIDIKDEE